MSSDLYGGQGPDDQEPPKTFWCAFEWHEELLDPSYQEIPQYRRFLARLWARRRREFQRMTADIDQVTPFEWEVVEDPPRSGHLLVRGHCLAYPKLAIVPIDPNWNDGNVALDDGADEYTR